jgi:hypothetical protein
VIDGFILISPTLGPWRSWGGSISLYDTRQSAQAIAERLNADTPRMSAYTPFSVTAARLVLLAGTEASNGTAHHES